MNLIELNRALRQLRLGGIAAVLEMRLHQAQVESMAPIDLISGLVSDELTRRGDRLLERRRKQAQFRDPQKTIDNFDFTFNPKMNRSLVFDLATSAFIARHEAQRALQGFKLSIALGEDEACQVPAIAIGRIVAHEVGKNGFGLGHIPQLQLSLNLLEERVFKGKR